MDSGVSDPKGSTLGGTLTVTAVKGVATFSDLVPHTASGAENLIAIEAKLTPAISDDFVVTADSAAKLVVGTAPAATAVAGTTLAGITVLVEDQFGNVCTTNTSDVTLALGTNPTAQRSAEPRRKPPSRASRPLPICRFRPQADTRLAQPTVR